MKHEHQTNPTNLVLCRIQFKTSYCSNVVIVSHREYFSKIKGPRIPAQHLIYLFFISVWFPLLLFPACYDRYIFIQWHRRATVQWCVFSSPLLKVPITIMCIFKAHKSNDRRTVMIKQSTCWCFRKAIGIET